MATIQLFINNELIIQLYPRKSKDWIYESRKRKNPKYHLGFIYVYLRVIWDKLIIQDSIKIKVYYWGMLYVQVKGNSMIKE